MSGRVERAQIVAAARAYIGTPFVHQGRLCGVGIDCAGLVLGVAADLGMRAVEVSGYGRSPDEDRFRSIVREHLDMIAWPEVLPGDVLTFQFVAEQHLAIVATVSPCAIVHAFEKVGRCVEQPLDAVWLRRLRGCYRFPEVG